MFLAEDFKLRFSFLLDAFDAPFDNCRRRCDLRHIEYFSWNFKDDQTLYHLRPWHALTNDWDRVLNEL